MLIDKLKVETSEKITGVNMSVFRVFAFLIFMPAAVFASGNSRATVDFVAEVGEARLMLAEHILRAAADFVSNNPEISAAAGHRGLAGILNEAPPFRSILAIDDNGKLNYDSFNAIRFFAAGDLSERAYFQVTTNAAPKEMIVNLPITGKQSGRVSVPLSMAVPNGSGKLQKVVVLMADPESLLPRVDACSFCGVILAQNNSVLVSNHLMSEVNEAIVNRLEFAGAYGAVEIQVRGMDVSVHWKKSVSTDLVFIYYEATPMQM